MSARVLCFLSVFFCASQILFPRAAAGPPPPPSHLEKYKAGDRSYALYKPPGWSVEERAVERGKTVTVSDPAGASFVVMKILKMRDRRENATTHASRTLKDLRSAVSGLNLAWARSTKDRRRAVMEIRYSNARNVPMRGRYYFNAQFPDATVFGYEAPEKEIERLRPTLLSVLTNFTILDPSGAAKSPVPPMTQRSAKDGSFTLLVPKGWKMDGAKGQVLCSTPGDGIGGFIFSSIAFWGPSRIPYFDSARIQGVIHSPYVRPVDALILAMRAAGSRNHKVLERASDPARAREASVFLKQEIEIETASISFDSRTGVRCQGYYDVSASRPLPSGQWGINVSGIWAPQKELPDYLPSLVKVAESYRIDERFAAEYVRRGMENLKRLTRETSEKMARSARDIRESSMAAYQERQRSQEYIDYKRTGYIRGEQEWVSQAEGGALYKSDHWGLSREGETVIEGQDYNYYNYKGRNPRYNETMTPVDISREVYESVYGK